uniref:C-X-C motif chemokine ligand 17 n=1 Tax=Canis lupus dingo TaxID=286419 RepID=A0A8C0KLP4_CANLU
MRSSSAWVWSLLEILSLLRFSLSLCPSPYCLAMTCCLPPGVARGHRDNRQAPSRRLQEDGQECECKDWFLRAHKRKLITVPGMPKKQCPCDHFKANVKKTSKEPKAPQEAKQALQSLPGISQAMSIKELCSAFIGALRTCSLNATFSSRT